MFEDFLNILYQEAVKTLLDLAPIIGVIAVFQYGVIRRPLAHRAHILIGLAYVAAGLTLFRIGIDEALIPIARDMAHRMVESAFIHGAGEFWDYLPILAFAALIGFTATLIEPTLIATADRVQDMSGGTLRAFRLRVLVAFGFALGLVLGTLRIIAEFPLVFLLAGMVATLILLVVTAPRGIAPLALDSGAIATSVVTVPLVTAYGMTVAESMPTLATAADGFGLIVLALLSPPIVLLAVSRIPARGLARPTEGGSDAV